MGFDLVDSGNGPHGVAMGAWLSLFVSDASDKVPEMQSNWKLLSLFFFLYDFLHQCPFF